MTQTVMLTLGRLPKALELARAFKQAGWRVVIAEPFAWHVSRPSRDVAVSRQVTAPAVDRVQYLKDLRDVAAAEAVDLIVPVSEETMHVAGLHGQLPRSVSLYAPPQSVLLGLHDKHAFIKRAQSFGLAAPRTFSGASAGGESMARLGPHVVKPVFSCSGKGVTINKEARELAVDHRSAKHIVQDFIDGQVLSSFSIAHAGRPLVTVLYKGTVMSGTVSVAFERVDGATNALRWIEDFITEANYSGFISFDLIETSDGTVYGIECNPRMTSGAHFVEPEDMVRAIVSPQDTRPIRFKAHTRFQQFYPCLTETQKSVFQKDRRASNLKNLLTSKDVIWQLRDPLPFIVMPMTSYKILAMSIFEGLSFGEASTRDIEWIDETDAPNPANQPSV